MYLNFPELPQFPVTLSKSSVLSFVLIDYLCQDHQGLNSQNSKKKITAEY